MTSQLWTMYVDNSHRCSHPYTLQFLLRVSCSPSLIATAHVHTFEAKNKCGIHAFSSIIYIIICSVHTSHFTVTETANAISVDCINYTTAYIKMLAWLSMARKVKKVTETGACGCIANTQLSNKKPCKKC